MEVALPKSRPSRSLGIRSGTGSSEIAPKNFHESRSQTRRSARILQVVSSRELDECEAPIASTGRSGSEMMKIRRPGRTRSSLARDIPENSAAHTASMRRTTMPGGPVLQRAARVLLRVPVRLLWPTSVTGRDVVPNEGPAVLCANHLSFFDSVVMMMTFDRPVYFVGKAEYLDSWKTRRLFPALGMIPIDRDNGAKAAVALDAATKVLRGGALLCVFPEGTRSRDGHLHRGYIGAARLALSAGCPILPVGIVGTREIQPPGARLPRPGSCSVSIGHPVAAGDVEVNGRRSAARALTNQVMERIAALSGQRYVAEHQARGPVVDERSHRERPRHARSHANVESRIPVPA